MSSQSQFKENQANQPDRIYLSSDDAISLPVTITNANQDDQAGYSEFTINLVQPVIKCRGVQLTSFVQTNTPADGPCIPDYTAAVLGFFYYKSGSPLTAATATGASLYFLALYAYASTPTTVAYAAQQNRYWSSYADFVSTLNARASLNNTVTPDVYFYYDSTQNKILFSGTNPSYYYTPAGYDDPNVQAQIRSNYAGSSPPIPYGYTLNMRCGFNNQATDFVNQQQAGVTYVNATTALTAATGTTPTGFPNLIRSTSITLRTNFNYQASINSKDNRDVLACVPFAVPFLGVNSFQYSLNHYLTNVPETIQQMTIRMYDDAGQPLPMGNNVNTLLEILCSYGGTHVNQ